LNATVTSAGCTLRSGKPPGRTDSNALQSIPALSVNLRITPIPSIATPAR
jgi:hypothetical protein